MPRPTSSPSSPAWRCDIEPISWTIVAQLIIKYGVPFVDNLIGNMQKQTVPTLDEWNALKAKIDTSFDSLVPKG